MLLVCACYPPGLYKNLPQTSLQDGHIDRRAVTKNAATEEEMEEEVKKQKVNFESLHHPCNTQQPLSSLVPTCFAATCLNGSGRYFGFGRCVHNHAKNSFAFIHLHAISHVRVPLCRQRPTYTSVDSSHLLSDSHRPPAAATDML